MIYLPRRLLVLASAGSVAAAAAGVWLGKNAQAQVAPSSSALVARKAATAGPGWEQLKPAQREALAPLAAQWDGLTEPHKRKWLALSKNFSLLSQQEQAMLHSRMAEWAQLSPQQRNQARFRFAETKGFSADDKKAQWEAYQALSEEERRKLAAHAATQPPGGAVTAVKPVPSRKLAVVPIPQGDPRNPPRVPPITAKALGGAQPSDITPVSSRTASPSSPAVAP
jgi:uncharacterized protein DUF3106